jgi:hypothetical protein
MGGSKSGGSSTTKTQLDPMLKPYVQFALQQGKEQYLDRAGNYQPYSGKTVAGFTPDTQDFFSGVRNLTAGTQGTAQAQGMATSAAQQAMSRPEYGAGKFGVGNLTADQIRAYQNPYTEDVINTQLAGMQRRAGEQAAALRTRQASAGALGGSRGAVESILADRESQALMADTEAKLRAQGYDAATSTALAQQERALQAQRDEEASRQFAEQAGLARGEYGLTAAGRIAQLAQQERDMETQRLEALRGIGTQQQLLSQAELDDLYKRYIEERDWDKNQLADYAAIAYGAPAGSTSTSSQSMSPWSTLGGLAMYGIGSLI